MDGFDITPASVRRSSDGMADVVDRLATAITDFESKLAGFGAPWGTGLLGMAFDVVYHDVHDMAIGSYEANGEVISEYAEGLATFMEDLEELEAEIKQGFEDILSELGSP
jgi:hypothetical protein